MHRIAACFIAFWGTVSFAKFTPPDRSQTPGALCNPKNPDFKGYDYPEGVARCNSNVSRDDKLKVAARYGDLPTSEWPKYEFDHLLPLCAGGSNELSNLWPQPLDQARIKDQLENDVCIEMQNGNMTQAQAIRAMHDWFIGRNQDIGADGTSDIYCRSKDGTAIRFDVVEHGWIAHIFVNVEDEDGEREVLHLKGSLAGHAANPSARGEPSMTAFSIVNLESGDVFELSLPSAKISKKGKSFYGSLRKMHGSHAAEEMRLHCTH